MAIQHTGLSLSRSIVTIVYSYFDVAREGPESFTTTTPVCLCVGRRHVSMYF